MTGELIPIEVLPGVEPITDRSSSTTKHYVSSKHIRFVGGYPEKIGGWQSFSFDGGVTIQGKVRSIFSYKLNGYIRYLVGTHTRLYDIFSGVLTNITPVKATTISIADSLDTYYDTLGSNPISTVDGSTTLTIADAAHKFMEGDTVTLSGAATTNGVPNSEINADHYVRSVSTNAYTVIISTPATSTGSGGGASVVRSSGYITVNATAHGLADGDRVKITAATATGGITAPQINLEFNIRNVATNAFDIYTEGTATSSVTGGGGASTEYQEPIDAGSADTLQGQGYGVGLYGVGLYGVSKTSTVTTPARIWSHDRFGDLTVSTPGNDGGIYSWDGDTAVAPTIVANAPTANYIFTSNNILVVLGYDTGQAAANGNGISWSDQGGVTNWTTGQAGSDTIEGAGEFLTHASARGENLLFTENQTYTFRYIGGQFIWQTRLLENGIGIISQNARVSALGVIFWMGNDNFYMWRGGNVEVIPSNSSSESTILNYVFDDINDAQKAKCFAWYNEKFREVWFHYPSSASNEPDRVARVNIDTFVWVTDELDRTAAEYPSILGANPYLSDDSSVIFLHENGVNADDAGMEWDLATSYSFTATNTTQFNAFIPDNVLTGNMSVTLNTKNYPNDVQIQSKGYTITGDSGRIAAEQNGRYFQFVLSGSDLDQNFQGGNWFIEARAGSRK